MTFELDWSLQILNVWCEMSSLSNLIQCSLCFPTKDGWQSGDMSLNHPVMTLLRPVMCLHLSIVIFYDIDVDLHRHCHCWNKCLQLMHNHFLFPFLSLFHCALRILKTKYERIIRGSAKHANRVLFLEWRGLIVCDYLLTPSGQKCLLYLVYFLNQSMA